MKGLRIYVGLVVVLVCSGVKAQSMYKQGYKLVFVDSFSTPNFDNVNTWKQTSYVDGGSLINMRVGDGHLSQISCDIYEQSSEKLKFKICKEQPGPGMWSGKKADIGQIPSTESVNIPDSPSEFDYVGGSFKSLEKYQYGYFEIRCKMPKDQCLYESFWMYSANNPWASGPEDDPDGGYWYNEIDIYEMHDDEKPDGTYEGSELTTNIHWKQWVDTVAFPGGVPTPAWLSDNTELSKAFDDHCPGDDYDDLLDTEFHVYGLEWTPNYIAWYKDGERIRLHTCHKYFPRHPMRMIVSFSLRNHLPQDDDDYYVGDPYDINDNPIPVPAWITSTNPAIYEIDYIAVYKKVQMENYAAAPAAGGWNKNYHRRFMADVNGDGLDDIVGFGWSKVYVSTAYKIPVNTADANCNNGSSDKIAFHAAEEWCTGFTYAQGWRNNKHLIEVKDINNDGSADIIGFGNNGVTVALGPSNALYNLGYHQFLSPVQIVNNFGYGSSAGGWRLNKHPRFVVDVNGDGMKDIVGCGASQVYVSLANSAGTAWGTATPWITGFCYAQGWRVNEHDRYLEDIDGDGDADIVGFGILGVTTSKSTGTTFGTPVLQLSGFGNDPSAGGWDKQKHRRMMVDISGDGRADIVGFGENDVWISSAGPTGTFSTPTAILNDFCYNQGYRVDEHEIYLRDIGGPAAPWKEIVAFYDDGVFAATIDTDPDTKPYQWRDYYGNDPQAGGFDPASHIRTMADCNGDGQSDIVCFGQEGVMVSPSSYCFHPTNIDEVAPSPPPSRLMNPNLRSEEEPTIETVNSNLQIAVIPNPTNGVAKVQLEGYSGTSSIRVVVRDVSGRTVLEKQLNNSTGDLDLSNHPNGLYIVRVDVEGKTHLQKLVKQ